MSNNRQTGDATGVEAIITLGADEALSFIPPLSDYDDPTPQWEETEYRHLTTPSRETTVGYWKGEPGAVSFASWPYTEICVILSGRVALQDRAGKIIEFGPGEGFVIPVGWSGRWQTLKPTRKIFVAASR